MPRVINAQTAAGIEWRGRSGLRRQQVEQLRHFGFHPTRGVDDGIERLGRCGGIDGRETSPGVRLHHHQADPVGDQVM